MKALMALYALAALAFGPIGRHLTEDMPAEKTHPFYPDHFWPYPILAMAVLVSLGLLAVLGQPVLQLGPAADPRLAINPRPEWYFLALFQFVKLGPALITEVAIPLLLVVGLLAWPLIDAWLGPRLARRFAWHAWPVPRQNAVTGTLWMAGLAIIVLLTLWVVLFPQLCVPWFFSGPVCGS
jgi:quinol-cytochrome oxidoreductase complex cytochrome b subunit